MKTHGLSCVDMCLHLRQSHLYPKLSLTQPELYLSGTINLFTAPAPADWSWLQRSSSRPEGWGDSGSASLLVCWPALSLDRKDSQHKKLMIACCYVLDVEVCVVRVCMLPLVTHRFGKRGQKEQSDRETGLVRGVLMGSEWWSWAEMSDRTDVSDSWYPQDAKTQETTLLFFRMTDLTN